MKDSLCGRGSGGSVYRFKQPGREKGGEKQSSGGEGSASSWNRPALCSRGENAGGRGFAFRENAMVLKKGREGSWLRFGVVVCPLGERHKSRAGKGVISKGRNKCREKGTNEKGGCKGFRGEKTVGNTRPIPSVGEIKGGGRN